MNCNFIDQNDILYKYETGKLEQDLIPEIEKHLQSCDKCRKNLALERAILHGIPNAGRNIVRQKLSSAIAAQHKNQKIRRVIISVAAAIFLIIMPFSMLNLPPTTSPENVIRTEAGMKQQSLKTETAFTDENRENMITEKTRTKDDSPDRETLIPGFRFFAELIPDDLNVRTEKSGSKKSAVRTNKGSGSGYREQLMTQVSEEQAADEKFQTTGSATESTTFDAVNSISEEKIRSEILRQLNNITYPEVAFLGRLNGVVSLSFSVEQGIISNLEILEEEPEEAGFGDEVKNKLSELEFPGSEIPNMVLKNIQFRIAEEFLSISDSDYDIPPLLKGFENSGVEGFRMALSDCKISGEIVKIGINRNGKIVLLQIPENNAPANISQILHTLQKFEILPAEKKHLPVSALIEISFKK